LENGPITGFHQLNHHSLTSPLACEGRGSTITIQANIGREAHMHLCEFDIFGAPAPARPLRYTRVESACENTGAKTITSEGECATAAAALGLAGGLCSSYNEYAKQRGCWLYRGNGCVEFNSNMDSTVDWNDGDSICSME